MSWLLRIASREAQEVDMRTRLNKLGNVLLTHRELTSHEAVYHSLSTALRQSNRTVIFIPSGFSENRTRLLKTKDQLKKLEDGSTSVLMTNLLDRYAARPEECKDMCYAEFAASFSVKYGESQHEEETDNADGDDVEDLSDGTIILRDNLGAMRRRKQNAILRYHQTNEDKNPEEFYYCSLLLFFHWMDEAADLVLSEGLYHGKYKEAEAIIKLNKSKFEKNTEEMDATFSDLEEGVNPVDGWHRLEEEKREEERMIHHLDPLLSSRGSR